MKNILVELMSLDITFISFWLLMLSISILIWVNFMTKVNTPT